MQENSLRLARGAGAILCLAGALSAHGGMYRGPGAPANGPPHHYMFEIFAVDIKLDVMPTADPFETRAPPNRPVSPRSPVRV